ncbi:MAG: RidA family protein [Akkermansia sp.]|nr:RidA family protein [Akkermansia sp.]
MELNESVLAAKGLCLHPAPAPVGSYVQCLRTGNYLHLSGGISINGDVAIYGKLGAEVSIEQGQAAAAAAILNRLAVIKAELGSFAPLRRIVAVNGFVNCTPDFTDQAKVLNGASDLLVELFGPEAAHTRSAVGVASLPLGVAVEINMIVEIDPAA